jgi:2-methylisocitrate lyase-like PEP mutase family enzyme
MTSLAERRAAFRALHANGCFCLPNPWDGASAVRLAAAGFKALASTSAGAAWALGRQDGQMSLEEVLSHLRFLCGVTDLPVNADFEDGFAEDPEGVGSSVGRCVATGVAGLSIEDASKGVMRPLDSALERLSAARRAIDRSGADVILVGRCEAYLLDPMDLGEVIRRLKAYAAAGADCVYAPGVMDLQATARLVEAVDKPLNVNLTRTGLSVGDFAAVGVRRVSLGGALAKATYAALDQVVQRLAQEGRAP